MSNHRLYYILFLFLIFVGCSPAPQYSWIQTKEGCLLWLQCSDTQSKQTYSWDGQSIGKVAHGKGTLTIDNNGKTIHTSSENLYYGTVNHQGVIEISQNEHYIGEVSSRQYKGFGVLIKGDEIFVGNFDDSNASGYCQYFKSGALKYKGLWQNHKFHGDGVLYTDNDSIVGVWNEGVLVKAKITQETKYGQYTGYIENNLPNGIGSMSYLNGWKYIGYWKDGSWNGYGELTTSSFEYSGEWFSGKPQGDGIVSFMDGGFYDGNWSEGKREGWGDAYNQDGTYYVGEWLDGEYNGQGSFYYVDDSYYDGQWLNGLQNGLGAYFSKNFTYVGQWEEGWINGEGRIEYANGDYYEGNFVENKRYGLGYYHFKAGNSYEGEFVDDVFNGLGRFYFQDGTLYEGEFLNGKICGDGTYYFIDNKDTMAITANWDGSSNFPKIASILFSNGDVYEGEIINGKPTKNGKWYPCESSWTKDKILAANDYYKLHKESIDKAVIITSLSLAVVATAAATIASAGAGTPALAATVSALTTVANTANTINTVINVADIAANVSSSAIDEDWEGVATEVAINAAFIFVPRGVTKVLTSKPARKAAVKLSQSAVSKAVRKSVITISKSKPYKKVSTVIIDKSGKISNAFVSSTKSNLEKFSKSKYGKRLAQKQMTKKLLKNKKLIEKFAKKLKISEKQKAELLDDIKLDEELGDLILDNPEFNIKRWLNTRQKVDKSLIAKGAKNRQYAGKNFYFHPSLNKNVQSTLNRNGTFSNYTKEQLLKLDKQFPNGVPYTKSGFPDFVAAGACKLDKNGKLIKITMPNGSFTGDRNKDFAIAREYAEKIYGGKVLEDGYIWHHLEGSPASMVLVKTECHEICRHAGGHSLAKNAKNVVTPSLIAVSNNIRATAARYSKSSTISQKAEILNSIKAELDNIPESLEKQKIFDELPNEVRLRLEKMWGTNDKYRKLPQDGINKGRWSGERGNSNYFIDENRAPKSDGYNNTRNKTMKQIIDENNLQKTGIPFKNGHPDFSNVSKGTVEVDYEPYIEEILAGNRESLHEAAFAAYAKQIGKSIDEVKVYKGDAAAASRLAQKWKCPESEVWKRCNNPQRKQLVWHEEPDCKTLRLVPIEVHANINHSGGISMAKIILMK